jgi:hypothetical protein
MQLKQLKKAHCHTRAHCATCRTDADWRERVTGVRDFACPHGVEELASGEIHDPNPPKSRGLGDTIAKVTDALHIPKCGRCKKRQAKLNKLIPYKEKNNGN